MGVDPSVSVRAVFLDRDGVLNRAEVREGRPHPPARLEDLVLLPGVGPALAALKRRGFLLVVVTNQPDVARGAQTRAMVEAMHAELAARLPIDEVRCCYHDDADGCGCRKPKPGLLLEAARDHDIDLGASFMVGDRWRDTEAGLAAGCTTIFIDAGYRERRPSRVDATVTSLAEASDWILAGETT
jgi:D-glycero-D-manno-heptose 1,7-bisphosphate phosphatase